MDFYTAWKFLNEHKMFNEQFTEGLWIEVVKVNPDTNEIDDDSSKNVKTRVWLEHGNYDAETIMDMIWPPEQIIEED